MTDILTVLSERHPDKTAVIDDRTDGTLTCWTFEELESRANKLAHMLLAFDVEPQTRVLWCGQNSAQIVAFTNACRKVGVTAVPMNYRLSADEAAYIVDNSDALVIFADAAYGKLFADISDQIPQAREVVIFDGPALAGQHQAESLTAHTPDTPPGNRPSNTNTLTMIYTSGTTGRPKGAVRKGRDVDLTQRMLKIFGNVAQDVYLT
ncbi:MAG: AMP-binding protein, partial [Gammaproteobacteria bacterium]|nr:AMP-binding protein [Gammaproteobacteria bacterium]